jgi:hypothetical protein
MARLAERVKDKVLLKLIRAYLQAGVMENGLVRATEEGTPQGGPLSPLLSNIVLDELDKELEKRQVRFVRYADDCNIYVKTWKAGQRAMNSVGSFIERKLRLKVNQSKSAVDRRGNESFWGSRELTSLGIPKHNAYEWGNSRKKYWRIALSPILSRALGNQYWETNGLQSLTDRYTLLRNRP